MKTTDNRKQSLYFPGTIIDEMQEQADRLDRSLSWLMQQAWLFAREKIRKLPKQELV